MTWILTHSGVKFDLINPRPEDVNIEDIAWALSNICRFAGHTSRFYSVAEHSVYMSRVVPPDMANYALFHDAAEAYTGDIIRPMKTKENSEREDKILSVILERFGILKPSSTMKAEVKIADNRMLLTERLALLPGYKGSPTWFPGFEGLEPFNIDMETRRIHISHGYSPYNAFLHQFKILEKIERESSKGGSNP